MQMINCTRSEMIFADPDKSSKITCFKQETNNLTIWIKKNHFRLSLVQFILLISTFGLRQKENPKSFLKI